MSDQDLEIVPVPGEVPPTSGLGPRRRRWPWALGAAVALIVALVFPVRTALAHAEVDRLQNAWAELVALDASRSTLINRLLIESVPTDAGALRQATIALEEEEADRVAALRRRLPSNRALDHGAHELRSAIARALDHEVAGLRAWITTLRDGGAIQPAQLGAPIVDYEAVQNQINRQRARFGEDLHDQHPSSIVLHAADATLAALSHFADIPLGARLLINTNFGVRVLDLDRSTDTAVDLGPDTRVAVAFGSVFAASQGRVFRLPADLTGEGRDIGSGQQVFPVPAHAGIWVNTEDGYLLFRSPDGTLLWGPEPEHGAPVGSVDAGVVVDTDPNTLSVVDPQNHWNLVRLIAAGDTAPLLIDARGSTVAYTFSRDEDVHLVSVSTGLALDLPVLGPDMTEGGAGQLSPDGQWLATYTLSGSGSATPVIVNLKSGALIRLSDVSNPDPQLSMAWTADSSRLFFTVYEDGATLATWHVGDSSATVLRWRSATATSVAVLP